MNAHLSHKGWLRKKERISTPLYLNKSAIIRITNDSIRIFKVWVVRSKPFILLPQVIQPASPKENIFLIIRRPSLNELALKNIHVKSMRTKVVIVLNTLWLIESVSTLNNSFILSVIGLKTSPITWNSPLSPPQTTKLQEAPCQRPLTRNVIIILICLRNFPFLLPPKGI